MNAIGDEALKRIGVNAIWNILVELGGAHAPSIDQFVHFMEEADQFREFRFCGKLGFGGKFWWNSGRMYVNCYREHETRSTKALIKRINAALAKLGGVA